MAKRVIILGAAGRDFHNFNVCYRDRLEFSVVAFTAAQIPDIADRLYPPELAGSLYPEGIPIYPESRLAELIRRLSVDQVVFAYSDVSHEYVMHRASIALSEGADFILLGPKQTMLRAKRPVISVGAVRTGAGKSPTARRVAEIIRSAGWQPVIVRHPMPYGDLAAQACQRYGSWEDLDRCSCTIEEREEYEPHLAEGTVVYAGIDYHRILAAAETEGDVILWEGGNNDFPFFRPNLHIVVVDPHRPGHERLYHPGETNVRMADILVISKVNTAAPGAVQAVRDSVRALNQEATIVEADLEISVDDEAVVAGRRVLVVEDGPTLTHGGMPFGAGFLAAQRLGATIIDPKPWAAPGITEVLRQYPDLGPVLPAIGYGKEQLAHLAATISATPCDAVVVATPVDLRRLISMNRPVARVSYELHERPDGALVTPILDTLHTTPKGVATWAAPRGRSTRQADNLQQ